jgi:hypothetical protein
MQMLQNFGIKKLTNPDWNESPWVRRVFALVAALSEALVAEPCMLQITSMSTCDV